MTTKICQSLDEVYELLDTSKWLVFLGPANVELFNAVKAVERKWVDDCDAAGCDVTRIDAEETKGKAPKRGRYVILVPPGVTLPPTGALKSTIDAWHAALANLAINQNKEITIGSRSAIYPVWLAPDGKDLPLETPPSYCATKVIKTYYRASRSARMTPEAALELIRTKINAKRASIENSKKNSDHPRAELQLKALDGLNNCLAILRTLTDAGDAVEVRIKSGRTCKISVNGPGASFTTTAAVIGLVPCAAGVEIVEHGMRMHDDSSSHKVASLHEAGMDVIIRSKK